ncbi:MAG: helix-turn-helix transcriptional regulator [Bacteroidia bacterium]|jgi:transcriptional regulator with XRE-family HTH domain|nr:helix-turn-helix transcriptional regulator [Bacteroidia bacterium]
MTLTKNMVSSFGEQLRSLREQKQLSLREVATEIGIDTSLLGKIERDERQPTKEQIKLVAKFFKFDENKLIREHLSDQLAYKIIEADADIDILKVAEQKIEYLKTKK